MSYEDKIREYLQGIEYDPENRTLTADEGDNHIANIRGWSSIRKLFSTDQEAGEFQDEMGKWIADAISRKLQSVPSFEITIENVDIGGFDMEQLKRAMRQQPIIMCKSANGGESQALQAAILGLHTLAGEFPTPTWKTREDYLQATISEINEILGKQ